jgi:hypothetical protein
LGGNIYVYENEKGRATFNGGGEFSIELSYSAETGDALSVARRVLRAMALETTEPQPTAAAPGASGGEAVTALFTYRRTAVFNCPVTLEFHAGQLARVSGRRPPPARLNDDETADGVADALLRFAETVRGGAVVCAEIYDAAPGYSFSAGAFGDGELAPGWRMVTDGGTFFVNSLTNEVEMLDI